jgi:hypothetical protein
MCSRKTRKTGCHCLQQTIRDSFAIAIRGLFAWLPLSICMKAVLRYLPIGLISDFQGVYYQVRQLQNVQQPAAQTMDPIKITLKSRAPKSERRTGGAKIRRGTVTNLTIWPSIRRNC